MWNRHYPIRERFATVWAPYDYWLDRKFTHCGINAFTLIRDADGWKLVGIAYTIGTICEPDPPRLPA